MIQSFRAKEIAVTDIILRPFSSCCYDMSACYGNGIKPETEASADSSRSISALSRNISAIDADFCAAVIADARPGTAARCDKASFSVNGQWNGIFPWFAAHPRRIDSRIVSARGELILPNESQRGFSCPTEIQWTISTFIFFFVIRGNRVNRQVIKRQRRLNTLSALPDDLHPEVFVARRSAERIFSRRFYRQKMSAESIIVRRQFFVGSGQRHIVIRDRLRFCQTPPR